MMSVTNTTAGFILRSPCRARQAISVCMIALFCLALSGCASWQQPADFSDSAFRNRAESQTVKKVRLSAAVLSTEDSKMAFGADVNNSGVQPVWIEVENNTEQMLWLLSSGTDPDMFSPLEVAWPFHVSFDDETNMRLDEHFDSLSFQNPIAAGKTQSGIIFTNPHDKTRMLNVDLLGRGEMFPFTLFLTVPDDQADEAVQQLDERVMKLIEQAPVDHQTADQLRENLEKLPCCAVSEDGSEAGDPLNVILVGEFVDIATSFVRRGFRIDVLEYDNAQQLFGRPPDIVARKTGQGGVPANWVRMWVAPFRYQGQGVLIVQTGRRQGWRLSEVEEENLMLSPKVDEVRNLLIQDMVYSSGLKEIAFVDGVGATEPGESRSSLGGASYQTDGLRAVLFFVTRPQSLSNIELLNWHPALKLREIEAVKEIENAGD